MVLLKTTENMKVLTYLLIMITVRLVDTDMMLNHTVATQVQNQAARAIENLIGISEIMITDIVTILVI